MCAHTLTYTHAHTSTQGANCSGEGRPTNACPLSPTVPYSDPQTGTGPRVYRTRSKTVIVESH